MISFRWLLVRTAIQQDYQTRQGHLSGYGVNQDRDKGITGTTIGNVFQTMNSSFPPPHHQA